MPYNVPVAEIDGLSRFSSHSAALRASLSFRVFRRFVFSCFKPALALDGGRDQVAPLGPAPVVVADIGIAEQVAQDEPGVAAALADAAVGHDRLVRGDPLAFVQGA